MNTRGGNGASGGMQLVVFGAAAGALGYAVVYFFDGSLGEERRRRVIEAAHAAMQEVVVLSQRLVAGAAAREPALEPAPVPEHALSAEPVLEPPRDSHEPAPPREIADTLRRKVTFFRLGDEEAEEAGLLAPVAVIAEELPAEPLRHEPAYEPLSLAPTIIAYDAISAPEPELPAAEKPRSGRTLLAAAAVVAVLAAAAALGAWAIWSGGDSNQATATGPAGAAQAISLISQRGARRIPVGGSNGKMVLYVTRTGKAVLIVLGLKAAPPGKEYQAWFVQGKTPHSAGLFRGGGPELVIPLQQRLPKDAIFAVTVERAGGVPAPTQAPEFTARLS